MIPLRASLCASIIGSTRTDFNAPGLENVRDVFKKLRARGIRPVRSPSFRTCLGLMPVATQLCRSSVCLQVAGHDCRGYVIRCARSSTDSSAWAKNCSSSCARATENFTESVVIVQQRLADAHRIGSSSGGCRPAFPCCSQRERSL